jgi:hypothetical protein
VTKSRSTYPQIPNEPTNEHPCQVAWCDFGHHLAEDAAQAGGHSRSVLTIATTAERTAFQLVDGGMVVPTISVMITDDRAGVARVMVSSHEPGPNPLVGEHDRWAEVYLTPGEARELRDALVEALELLDTGPAAAGVR